jgi:hypothetical protein
VSARPNEGAEGSVAFRQNSRVNARRVAAKSRTADKPRVPWKGVLNLVVTVLVLLLGPAMIVFGQHLINVDEDLARTGTQTSGVVIHFDDVSKASQRRMQVEFVSVDGEYRRTWVSVDHDQHPELGDETTVIYRELDPSHAIVPGYESDGVWFRGAGTVVTSLFVGIGIFLAICLFLGARKRRKQRPLETVTTE